MATVAESLATLSPPISVQQWGELPEKAGYELVDGQLVEKPIVAQWHGFLNLDLAVYLANFVKAHKLGRITCGPSRLKISAIGGREPDIYFIPTHMYPQVGPNYFCGIPPLVVEILSPTNEHTDREDKYEEYAQLGIPEYWIVDFANRCIEIHRLKNHSDGGQRFELSETHRGDAIFRPALFPGLEIPLAEIWPTEFEHRTDEEASGKQE